MKSSLRKVLPKNTFARSVAVLSGGTVSAQILLLLAAPALTRLYSPEDFGLLAVFASMLSILGIVASLRYELAIPIAEDDRKASYVVALCLVLTVFMSLLTALMTLIAGERLVSALNVSNLEDYLWLLPIGVFLTGIYQAFNYWAIREKAFARISGTKITQSVTSLLVQFSCYKLGPLGLLAGYITGQFAGASKLAKSAFANPHFRETSYADIKGVAIRYKQFPQFATWSGLVNTSGHQFAPLVLAAFFGVSIAGWYALANRVVAMPATLIGGAVGNVFFAHATDAQRNGQLALLVENTQEKLISISFPIALVILLFGKEIFIWGFGTDWAQAGIIAQWLILSSLAGFLVSSVSMIFSVLERQRLGLALQTALFSFRFAGLMIGILKKDYTLAIMLFALGGVIGYSLYVIAIISCTGASALRFVRACFLSSIIATLMVSPVLLLMHSQVMFEIMVFGLILSGVAFIAYYFYALNSFFSSH